MTESGQTAPLLHLHLHCVCSVCVCVIVVPLYLPYFPPFLSTFPPVTQSRSPHFSSHYPASPAFCGLPNFWRRAYSCTPRHACDQTYHATKCMHSLFTIPSLAGAAEEGTRKLSSLAPAITHDSLHSTTRYISYRNRSMDMRPQKPSYPVTCAITP